MSMEQKDDPHRPERAAPKASSSSLWSNASASAGASIISRLCTHPLDTIKARIQVRHATQNFHTTVPSIDPKRALSSSTTTTAAATIPRDILKRGSLSQLLLHYLEDSGRRVRSLYRGLGIVIVGGTPGTMLYLCSYDIMKENLSRISSSSSSSPSNSNNNHYNFLIHFFSGMMAEAFACIVYVPVDVIKERMQVQQAPPSSSPLTMLQTTIHTTHSVNERHGNYHYYRNTYDAMRQILQTEGIRGIYRGYAATLASFGPFSALYFVFYEYFKEQARASIQQQEQKPKSNRHDTSVSSHKVEIPFHWTVICAATAGGLASFITSPLDMAKLRLQVQRSGNSLDGGGGVTKPYYTSMMDCLQKIYRQDGTTGLFRGAGARVCHFAPATTVTMTMYDTLRPWLES